jgi:hypothetical protein
LDEKSVLYKLEQNCYNYGRIMNLVTDLQYFPSTIFYKNSYKFTHIIIEQCETYQKMSFRNRCQIAGAEGVIDLSVPLVKGRDQKTVIRDVKIAGSSSWQARHWKTILSCYSRSPWFEFYRDDLEALYRKPFAFLVDWNLYCLEWSFRALGMTQSIILTDSYRKSYPAGGEVDEEWVDLRGRLLPKRREEWSAGPDAPRYRQVFEERIGFQPGLSILDLLFCEGRNAIRYIRS